MSLVDVWMATCLVFAFAALIEFAVVNVLSQKLPGRRFSLAALFHVPAENEEKSPDTESSVNDIFKEVTSYFYFIDVLYQCFSA